MLDFCNTQIFHRDTTHEFLSKREDFLRWLAAASQSYGKNIAPKTRLRGLFGELSAKQFRSVLDLRGVVRDYFQAMVDKNARKRKAAVDKLNRSLANVRTWRALAIGTSRDEFQERACNTSDLPSYWVSLWLHQFLSQADPGRVKRCKNTNCSHFFYDVSKNNSRDWCSMRSCGNLMKARAFHLRSKRR